MSDTMIAMELRFADTLFPNQLEVGDLIKVDDYYVTIDSIHESDDGYNIVVLDDFDEPSTVFLFDDEKVELYVFVE